MADLLDDLLEVLLDALLEGRDNVLGRSGMATVKGGVVIGLVMAVGGAWPLRALNRMVRLSCFALRTMWR